MTRAHGIPMAARGFTLLEILGVIVLLTLLLAGVYAGVRTALHTVHSGEVVISRLDEVRSAQQFLRGELAQAQAVPIARADDGSMIYFSGNAHEMRYVAALPGYLGKLGPQLQQLKLVPNDKGGMRLEASFAVIPPDGRPPRPLGDPQVLVDGIRDGSFSYRTPDTSQAAGKWVDSWKTGGTMPRIVEIALRMNDTASWPRLDVPLRVVPPNMQGQSNFMQGLPTPGAL